RTDALTHALMDRSVWPRIAVDSVLAGKRYILGHNQNRGLDRRYTRLGMETLYEGRSSKGHDSRLFFYTRSSMSTLIVLRTIALPWLLLIRKWG
ncbi:MAG: hypothetical protein JNG84_13060, partial [Archangium sp.]|nr:hypothetical protein [Archangium sp.]